MSERARRYDRQKRLPEIGEPGQERLARRTAAIVGLGALGSVAADLLARAGVGRLILIDRDVVDWTNLQRQSLYTEDDAARARPKAAAAVARLQAVNSEIELVAHARDLDAANHRALLDGADLLVDGTDNFATRYLLNDHAVARGIPYVYAGVVATYGMVACIVPPDGPCLRCTYPEPPESEHTPTCASAGVLGPAVSVVAGLAAAQALRLLTSGAGWPGFLSVDVWSLDVQRVRAARDPHCPCCGARDFAWAEGRRGARTAEALCGGNAVQIPAGEQAPDLAALAERLNGAVDGLAHQAGFLRFAVSELDVVLFADGRALIRGTEDPGRARAVLAETLGD